MCPGTENKTSKTKTRHKQTKQIKNFKDDIQITWVYPFKILQYLQLCNLKKKKKGWMYLHDQPRVTPGREAPG